MLRHRRSYKLGEIDPSWLDAGLVGLDWRGIQQAADEKARLARSQLDRVEGRLELGRRGLPPPPKAPLRRLREAAKPG